MGPMWPLNAAIQPCKARYESSHGEAELPNTLIPMTLYSSMVEVFIPGGCKFKDSRDALNINCDTREPSELIMQTADLRLW